MDTMYKNNFTFQFLTMIEYAVFVHKKMTNLKITSIQVEKRNKIRSPLQQKQQYIMYLHLLLLPNLDI